MDPSSTVASRPARPWPLFLFGLVLVVAGLVAYFILFFSMHRLWTPWYVPILSTIGALLMVTSVWRRRGIVRGVLAVLFLLFAGFTWMALVSMRTPEYAGPATPGHTVPTFTAALANGTSFTNEDLEGGSPSVVLFFRGQW